VGAVVIGFIRRLDLKPGGHMILGIIGLILLLGTGTLLLLVRDWRFSIGLLAIQYLAMFMVVMMMWPFSVALIKLMVGWMAAAVLSTSGSAREAFSEEPLLPMGRVFRITLAVLILIVVLSVSSQLNSLLPEINIWIIRCGLLAVGLGLVHVGITTRPYRIILGLLTILAGFEIIYAAVEVSFLVIGLLAGVNLALALAGVYFGLFLKSEEET
jgi:hypothetical protein